MNPERVKLLEQYMNQEPSDPFPIYLLALELVNAEPHRSEVLFDILIEFHSDYLATYYQAGQLAIASGNLPKAKEILKVGIEKASSAKDQKASSELASLLEGIE